MLTKRTISTTVSEQVTVHGDYNLKNLKPTKWMHKHIYEIKNKLDKKNISAVITLSQGHQHWNRKIQMYPICYIRSFELLSR